MNIPHTSVMPLLRAAAIEPKACRSVAFAFAA